MGEVVTGKALAVNGPGQQRPYLRTKNVFDGRIDISDVLTMPMTDAMFAHFMLLRSDVLLNEGQSLDLVGRCAIYQDEYPRACAIQNQLLRFRAKAGVSSLFASHLFRYSRETGVFARVALQTTSIAHLGSSRFARLQLPWPKSGVEQRAIAEALSDVDKLLGSLEKLIAKKRAIKQAAMQQLLTGETRLPGFSEEWETKRLGNIALLQRGFDLPTSQIRPGSYAVVYSNGVLHHHERAMVKGPGVVTGRSGTIGKVHFIEKDYWPHNTALWVTSFRGNDPKFIYYFYTHIDLTRFLSGSGVPTLNRNDVHQYLASYPPLPEQRAIATVLSDMDADIAALERRRDKTHALKQGMMQQLLTGKIRIAYSDAPAER